MNCVLKQASIEIFDVRCGLLVSTVVFVGFQNMKRQRVAEAAMDSMKGQMLELCRSDTLSRAREQHDRDLTVMKEQHDAALLTLQLKLDSNSQALNEQVWKMRQKGNWIYVSP